MGTTSFALVFVTTSSQYLLTNALLFLPSVAMPRKTTSASMPSYMPGM
jgi:hypothetical protein